MSIFPEKILLATDGSPDARLAARAAADLSRLGTAALHVVHAWEPVYPATYPYMLPENYAQTLEERAGELLAQEVERIESIGGTVERAHLRMGRPADEVVAVAKEIGAGLIVVGSRGLGPVRRLVMGSVSEDIVHRATCPVLVMRGGDDVWPPARVVLADDASDEAGRATDLVASIGSLFGARGTLVRAYPRLPWLAQEGGALDERVIAETLQHGREALAERADDLAPILAVRPEWRVSMEDPAAAILEAAEEGQGPVLIAVGSRGVGAIQRMAMGSVSTKILRAAHAPVLVYPHQRAGTQQ